MVDDATRKTLSGIPLLRTKAGPRDKDLWPSRLKEEYQALIKYVQNNKENDNDWFRLESNKDGTRWFGKCWYIHELLKYEFDVEFDVCTQAIPEMSVERGSKYTDTLFPRSYREVNNTSCQKIPVTYPTTAPEIALPSLDGKTAKMYRGGKICMTDHFKPLWARNVPKFGIAHAMALGLGPWLAVEIPDLIQKGVLKHKDDAQTKS
ncbi:ubiquitin-fold modifier-conjugating enzyme 1 isoform X1 [Dermacentor andersoni]|uniref:ubiquitin-fold modifier-conjugating enzyme 1 isoform X1 n=1 Tax=Dermacentor andersoni TaxID=34620 RepID=UPI0024177BE3|nr:ubiquitin-fold modifier-conjugating enzyme 1 isoform X1 [Dermacentor andersoni]